jgi:hypothetical protein
VQGLSGLARPGEAAHARLQDSTVDALAMSRLSTAGSGASTISRARISAGEIQATSPFGCGMARLNSRRCALGWRALVLVRPAPGYGPSRRLGRRARNWTRGVQDRGGGPLEAAPGGDDVRDATVALLGRLARQAARPYCPPLLKDRDGVARLGPLGASGRCQKARSSSLRSRVLVSISRAAVAAAKDATNCQSLTRWGLPWSATPRHMSH